METLVYDLLPLLKVSVYFQFTSHFGSVSAPSRAAEGISATTVVDDTIPTPSTHKMVFKLKSISNSFLNRFFHYTLYFLIIDFVEYDKYSI